MNDHYNPPASYPNYQKFKIVFLGDQSVGKSSILTRFVRDSFDNNPNSTIGVDFIVKTIQRDDKTFKIHFWDTAGQERYNSLASSYSRDSRACILVYDITNRDSFLGLRKWHNNIKDHLLPEVILVVVGNKEDMIDQEASTLLEGHDYAESIGALYMRTSAKQGTGIKELFTEISKKILGVDTLSIRESVRTTRGISLCPSNAKPKKKSCCK